MNTHLPPPKDGKTRVLFKSSRPMLPITGPGHEDRKRYPESEQREALQKVYRQLPAFCKCPQCEERATYTHLVTGERWCYTCGHRWPAAESSKERDKFPFDRIRKLEPIPKAFIPYTTKRMAEQAKRIAKSKRRVV